MDDKDSASGPARGKAGRQVSLPGAIDRQFMVARASLAAIAIVAALLAVSVHVESLNVLHQREILRLSRQALSLAVDRETGIRGFLIAGDSLYLEPELTARKPLEAKLDSLRVLARDESGARLRVQAVQDAYDAWQAAFVVPILGSGSEMLGSTRLPVLARGRQRFDALRRDFAVLLSTEEALYLTEREHEAQMRWFALFVVLASLLALGLGLRQFRRTLVEQASSIEEQQETLEGQSDELEAQLQESQHQAVELELANERLHVVSRRLEFLLQSSPLPIAIFDRDRRPERVNPAFAALLPEAQRDDPLRALPAIAEMVDHILAGGDPVLGREIVLRDPLPDAGANTTWSASVHPVSTFDREMLGVGVVLLELTRQRELEEQIRHVQRMESIGRLTGGIAHDFNNILTAITGFGDLALESVSSPERARKHIDQVLLAASRATALTRQLLAFSRQQVLQPRRLNLNVVVHDMYAMLQRLIRERVTIDTVLAPDLSLVSADQGQIGQVLMNMVVNARDAMRHGGRIRIATDNVRLGEDDLRPDGIAAGTYVRLEISDTGIGMDEATRRRVFEPFFTTKDVGSGTGLGLSTAYGIVKQSGGGIDVQSAPGHGATFSVYLPRDDGGCESPDEPFDWEDETSSDDELPDVPGTILLVEDDAYVMLVTSQILRDHGHHVLTAEHGRAALDVAATSEVIDLVISDLEMPEMGGLEMVAALRVSMPDVGVIFMSGYTADAADQRQLLPADTPFIEKPFTVEILLRRVRSVLHQRR